MKSSLTCCLIVILHLWLAAPLFAQSENNPPPLRRVTLYKHGVGYFERRGRVRDEQQVSFSFDAAQMNDVLKSLVVLDLSRGRISAVTFDSTKPLEKRLEEFGISLEGAEGAGLTALLGQLKGTRVEVKSAAGSSTGAVVGLERRARTQGPDKVESQDLVLVSEGGELRSIPLDQVRGVKLLDPRLRDDLDRYLSILQSTVHKNAKNITITATGKGERDLFVSYVVEAPVWKTTYRVVIDGEGEPFLQGWAVVDNVQDEDWTNVSLSLVAGLPVSFIQDLQQPRYKRRPVVGMPEDYSLTPQVHEAAVIRSLDGVALSAGPGSIAGLITDASGAAVAGAAVTAKNLRTGKEVTGATNGSGQYSIRGLPSGNYEVRVSSAGFKNTILNGVMVGGGTKALGNLTLQVGQVSETVSVMASRPTLNVEKDEMSAISLKDSGVEAEVSTQEVGELFEYRIDHPVTIRRHSSALIPIVQSKIQGESASLYNPATLKPHPMSALYLTNTTGLTLEGGPLTVIENETYSGEALTGRIKPGERRFITYAVDLGCRVSTKEGSQEEAVFLAEIINGEFRLHYRQVKTTTYTLANVTGRPKTIYLEHPYHQSQKWQLVKTPEPVETTENFRRFKVEVAPNATVQFAVHEELPEVNAYQLSNLTTDQITYFVSRRYLSAEMKKVMEELLDLKSRIALLNRQLQEKQQAIGGVAKDQERLRENLRALGKSEEERQLVSRYVTKLSQGEDQLERLRQEEAQLIEQRQALQRQLDERLRELALEHKLG